MLLFRQRRARRPPAARGCRRNAHRSQIYEQVFTPQCPVSGERVVNTDTRGPSQARATLLRNQRGEDMERITKRQRMADAAPSQSARRIDKGAVVRKSQARTQRRKPSIALGKVLQHANGGHKSRLAGV